MSPYYADDWLTIYQGDVRAVLPELASDSVDCIVTSPPYWGLRDYGTANWDGGDPAHEHVGQELRTADTGGPKQQTKRGSIGVRSGDCECGATRSDNQIGLERTPEEYVANMVAVFRELRRVLKPSGTCWLNLGDSFFGGAGSTEKRRKDASGVERPVESKICERCGAPFEGSPKRRFCSSFCGGIDNSPRVGRSPLGLKPKDLVGIPWRVAFALQADGWYLRSDIIWSKPNPMPESVTDRPTKAHEYLFLLTKSARYYFDSDAVRESVADATVSRLAQDVDSQNGSYRQPGKTNGPMRAVGTTAGRNIRSVWTIATRPYPGAHFAVFPPELPERCIKAGSSERGVCPECGAPWERVVERSGGQVTAPPKLGQLAETGVSNNGTGGSTLGIGGAAHGGAWAEHGSKRQTLGWDSTCEHYDANYHPLLDPAVVLDPFAGSGTTGMVANRLSRRATLIDLNGDYLKQQLQRNAQTPLGLSA